MERSGGSRASSMSERRAVWATLAALLRRVENGVERSSSSDASMGGLEELEKEVRKLGKTQFKANTLVASQSDHMEKALALLEAQQQQQTELLDQLVGERLTAARQEWLASLLPVLDGLDHAIESGENYLRRRDLAATVSPLTPAQAALVSPADRAMMAGWLEGQVIIRDRLLKSLEAQGVTAIPAVGLPFDPFLHVVVATVSEGAAESGTIVAEERRGYRTRDAVLRFAHVVVYKEKS